MRTQVERDGTKLTVRVGNKKAAVYAGRSGNRAIWSLKWRDATGKRRASTFTTEKAAVDAAENALVRGDDTTSAASMTVADIVRLLESRGVKKEPIPEKTGKEVSFRETMEAYQKALIERGCSERHTRTVWYHLARFERACGKPLQHVTVADANAFLLSIPHPKTRKNLRGTLVSLGEFGKKRGWLPWAAPTVFELTDSPVVKTKEHDIFQPAEIKKILDYTSKHHPHIVPWLALGAFAGIRAAERFRLSWDDIDFEHKVVTLGTAITKTARRRVVDMPDNLIAWLKAHRQYPICPPEHEVRLYEILNDISDKVGVGWIPNGLRASAASYHLMRFENAPKTSLQLGHSVRELETVYYRPALKSQAEAWYSVTPSSLPA